MLKNEFFSLFPDCLLSKKRLASANSNKTMQSETEITQKVIKAIYKYKDRSPVYYEWDPSPASLNRFIDSEKFNFLKWELDCCIQYLNNWVAKENIKIENGDGPIPAESIFNYFLDCLKSDIFSDHRTLLYSSGKKNLEIISLLVRKAGISLAFRKQIVITLLSDEGLTLCAGGCLTRLSEAAESLKNYGAFTPSYLIKNFIVKMAKEIALRKAWFHKYNYSQRICFLAKTTTEDYEIHAVNYLFAKLSVDLGLFFSDIQQDPHIETLGHYLKEQQSEAEAIYCDYLNECQREINLTNLIRFISYQLNEQCLCVEENFNSLVDFIETRLAELGQDSVFSLSEVFSEEGHLNLKNGDNFMITIAERLLASEWLVLPTPLEYLTYQSYFIPPKQTEATTISSSKFRFYPNNIALSWVKNKGKRQAMVVVVNEGFNMLNKKFYLFANNLKFLLRSLGDLYFFLRICLRHSMQKY
ncbi:MAG: hypothetical protein V4471_06650 [Pseudomonadota bacterium]